VSNQLWTDLSILIDAGVKETVFTKKMWRLLNQFMDSSEVESRPYRFIRYKGLNEIELHHRVDSTVYLRPVLIVRRK